MAWIHVVIIPDCWNIIAYSSFDVECQFLFIFSLQQRLPHHKLYIYTFTSQMEKVHK